MSSAQWLWVLPIKHIDRGAEPRPSELAIGVALGEAALEELAEDVDIANADDSDDGAVEDADGVVRARRSPKSGVGQSWQSE